MDEILLAFDFLLQITGHVRNDENGQNDKNQNHVLNGEFLNLRKRTDVLFYLKDDEENCSGKYVFPVGSASFVVDFATYFGSFSVTDITK